MLTHQKFQINWAFFKQTFSSVSNEIFSGTGRMRSG